MFLAKSTKRFIFLADSFVMSGRGKGMSSPGGRGGGKGFSSPGGKGKGGGKVNMNL